MSSSRGVWTEERVEQLVGRLLQIGVSTAAAIVLTGGVLYLMRHGIEHRSLNVFGGEPLALRTVDGIWRAAVAVQARGIIQLGVLVLICTPIARVVFTALAFARARDHTYVTITLTVLILLLFGLLYGQ